MRHIRYAKQRLVMILAALVLVVGGMAGTAAPASASGPNMCYNDTDGDATCWFKNP